MEEGVWTPANIGVCNWPGHTNKVLTPEYVSGFKFNGPPNSYVKDSCKAMVPDLEAPYADKLEGDMYPNTEATVMI
ncbi:hypothetical protein WICPIJ_005967 [Wickerhamomyces pijperi]|uniref:Uncharacterized protein n=1 Tax=Wickerhamomyces pijperi TaxID=599730 RepID=A0A9P8TKM0_WICPI|nr:hypothetical protein WICPIJ_005967 [Wickerhamomyces pijperi]